MKGAFCVKANFHREISNFKISDLKMQIIDNQCIVSLNLELSYVFLNYFFQITTVIESLKLKSCWQGGRLGEKDHTQTVSPILILFQFC